MPELNHEQIELFHALKRRTSLMRILHSDSRNTRHYDRRILHSLYLPMDLQTSVAVTKLTFVLIFLFDKLIPFALRVMSSCCICWRMPL
jgi:hypothetical protein